MGKASGRFKALPLAGGWTGTRDMPAPQGQTFMSRWQVERGRRQRQGKAA
jgi:L-lactate dehydrogenase complex protein LldF